MMIIYKPKFATPSEAVIAIAVQVACLIALAALFVSAFFSPAKAETDNKSCPSLGEHVTISGKIESRIEQHHLSIYADGWPCLGNMEDVTLLNRPLSMKWLDHRVTVTGLVRKYKYGVLIDVESIKDENGTGPPDSERGGQ